MLVETFVRHFTERPRTGGESADFLGVLLRRRNAAVDAAQLKADHRDVETQLDTLRTTVERLTPRVGGGKSSGELVDTNALLTRDLAFSQKTIQN